MAQLATLVLFVHLLWLALVVVGAFFTRGRPLWAALHILALLWGIAVELSPWPCPLTLMENYFESRAGITPYRGGFLLHYLDAIVYPDLPGLAVTLAGVAVCALNLGIYGWRLGRYLARRRALG